MFSRLNAQGEVVERRALSADHRDVVQRQQRRPVWFARHRASDFKNGNARSFYPRGRALSVLSRLFGSDSSGEQTKGGENVKVLTSRGGGVLQTIPRRQGRPA